MPRIFPRSSAFEAQLAKVYLELWDLQDQPALFARRVETFVDVFLPTMFQDKLKEMYPDLGQKLDEMIKRVNSLEAQKVDHDPFTQEAIHNEGIPAEEAAFAREVWHAVVDVLTKAGFNFPMATEAPRRKMT